MSVRTFSKIVPPPMHPRCATGDWESVERHLGLRLPDDYKAFIREYGTGSLQSFLHVMNYLDDGLSGNGLREYIAVVVGQYRLTDNDARFYPEPGGLLPFVSTDDGHYLNWVTDGDADDWTVAAFLFPEGRVIHTSIGMVECLTRLVQGDNPFGSHFCNVEQFKGTVTFQRWDG